ncbi:MAG: hypothetical protein U0939_05280 [Pirellulales bacterium]
MRQTWRALVMAAAAMIFVGAVEGRAADKWGLKNGAAELKSAGQLAFGPDGILFVGDAKAATVFAIGTGDAGGEPAKAKWTIEGLQDKLATLLGASAPQITVNDLAVNPATGNVFLSVTAGERPALVRLDAKGLSEISLKDVPHLKAALANPPEDKITGEGPRKSNRRLESITDLAFADGKVIVAGLTGDKAPSTVRELPFPFADGESGTPIEIYHGAHGKLEDYAPVRTFVPFTINGEASLLAGFTCTPLVRFSVGSLEPGKKVRGTTVAELGNRNKPLDMIVYKKDGKDFLLMSNSARGVMKISTQDIGRAEGITAPISGGGTSGQPYETVKSLEGVVQLDKLNDAQAVIVSTGAGGVLNLSTVDLP